MRSKEADGHYVHTPGGDLVAWGTPRAWVVMALDNDLQIGDRERWETWLRDGLLPSEQRARSR